MSSLEGPIPRHRGYNGGRQSRASLGRRNNFHRIRDSVGNVKTSGGGGGGWLHTLWADFMPKNSTLGVLLVDLSRMRVIT